MDLQESITRQTEVALEITKQLLETDFKDKNMVYSPLSLHIALSLIAAGTKGPTHDQFLSFLKSKSIDDLNNLAQEAVNSILADNRAVDLSFANSVWVDKSLPFKPVFKKVADSAYNAACNDIDFKTNPGKARIEVNAWIEKMTKGLIAEALPPNYLDSRTRLVFANALYFKAYWKDRFTCHPLAEPRRFYLLNGDSVMVPFMSNVPSQLIGTFEGFKVLKLLYRKSYYDENDTCFSMCIFLPDARDGLPALVERVCSESGFIDRHLPNEKVYAREFRIPKFKIDSGFEASEIVKKLGLVLPFTFEYRGGNVTEMVESPAGEDPYVAGIFQKSFIEINEEGTVAAACNVLHLRGGGGPPEETVEFVADHPFMFLIREESSGVVLFVGQVASPLAG